MRAINEAYVQSSLGQILELLPTPALEQVQVQLAVVVPQVGEQPIDAQIAGIDVQSQAQHTADRLLQGAGPVADRVDHGQGLGGLGLQHLAFLGEPHPLGGTGEEHDAQLLLQAFDMGADRGLAGVETLGGAGQVPLFGNGDECFEVI